MTGRCSTRVATNNVHSHGGLFCDRPEAELSPDSVPNHSDPRDDGKRRYTVAQIAAEFGVTRPPSTATSPPSAQLPSDPSNRAADCVW